ncbi:MAG: lipopolysaccharide biosynthesis protein [Sphingomicrobium sp.]
MGKTVIERPGNLRSLTQQTLSGFFWQSGVAAVNLVVRAVILILLARHLPPGDFGIVAAAMVVSNITQVVTQIGVAKALVQRHVLLEQHVRSGFLATVLMGAAATALLAIGAPLFAAPFKLEGLEPVIRFLSVLLLLNSITAVPMALIHRARKFRISSGIELLSFLFGYGGVGMLLTLAGFGVWSLAVAEVSHAASRMLLYMFFERPLLGLRWNRTALKELFEVGSGYSAGQIGNLLATQIDYLIVGRMLGATALGLYSRAYQFLMLPAQLIGSATQTVLFPSIASIQDQPDRVARAFLRATGVIALSTIPISGVLMILGPELVNLTLGPRWQGMIVPFQILIATLLFRTSYKISDSVSLALGSMVQRAWRQWIYAGAVAAGASLGARWGLPGVSAGVGAAVALNFLMMLQLAMRVTGVSAYRMLVTHVSHVLAALPIVVAVGASVSLARMDGLDDLLVLALGLGTAALMAGLLWWRCRWIFGADGEWAHGVAAARLAPHQAKFRA